MTRTVTLRMVMGRTATETAALDPAEVATAVAAWARYAKKRGLSREDAKSALIGGLVEGQHEEEAGAAMLTCVGLWLAWEGIKQRPDADVVLIEASLRDDGDYDLTISLGVDGAHGMVTLH